MFNIVKYNLQGYVVPQSEEEMVQKRNLDKQQGHSTVSVCIVFVLSPEIVLIDCTLQSISRGLALQINCTTTVRSLGPLFFNPLGSELFKRFHAPRIESLVAIGNNL